MDKDDNYRANDNGGAIENSNDNDIKNHKGKDEIYEDPIQDQEKVIDSTVSSGNCLRTEYNKINELNEVAPLIADPPPLMLHQ